MGRVASVRVDMPDGAAPALRFLHRRLATALLAGSPRVALAGLGLCRIDARGWERRGGEIALARTLREAAMTSGFRNVRVGIGDVAVVADAASRIATSPVAPAIQACAPGTIVVKAGSGREFLAPLPLDVLPIPAELRETLQTLGFRCIGELATRDRSELETRFGPPGSRAHRLACGEDERVFRPIEQEIFPEASLELDGPTEILEPLLFVLRHLLGRVCADLLRSAWCAARLSLDLLLADGTERRARIVPARPTRQERLLYDLCRAALERAAGDGGRLAAPVTGLTLRVDRTAEPDARQGDLFTGEWRDPMAAAIALSRLRARMGNDVVVWPRPRPDHRPETRNAWGVPGADSAAVREGPLPHRAATFSPMAAEASSSVLRLLPDPVSVGVRTEGGRPVELCDAGGRHCLVVAEGPERLSGDWWRDLYRREYYRACTAAGELLWLFREYRRDGELRWWLHGWWD